jgi:hypothetical protein
LPKESGSFLEITGARSPISEPMQSLGQEGFVFERRLLQMAGGLSALSRVVVLPQQVLVRRGWLRGLGRGRSE